MPERSTRSISLRFHGDLIPLLRRKPDGQGSIVYPPTRRASIKDIVESLGIPHTEVGSISSGGRQTGFDHIPRPGDRLDIRPASPDFPPTRSTVLRPEPLDTLRFMVDRNVARLGRLLRLAGIDAEAAPPLVKRETAAACLASGRIMLSRDRELLKHRIIVFGRLVRHEDPVLQAGEVIGLFGLAPRLRPFSRCAVCNGTLQPVAKEAILDRLEPLTKRYYDEFKMCPSCTRVYWRGSHYEKMIGRLERITQALRQSPPTRRLS